MILFVKTLDSCSLLTTCRDKLRRNDTTEKTYLTMMSTNPFPDVYK